ncbi:MAG TPA: ABC transporter permease [Gaiellaceae bacterium]|nr:ABC transporter permease [Gaiellaceae bacterium]
MIDAARDRLFARTGRLADARGLGTLGVLLGLLALWLALPPWTVRDLAVPIAVGFLAAACGVAAFARGERSAGAWALAAAVLGTGAALWAQGVERDTLEGIFTAGLVASTLRFATPLAFAACGGIFSERSGVVNIGLEGMMLTGAFFAVWGSIWSGAWVVGLLMAMLFGGLLALVHAFFSIHLRADQIVSGFAVNFLALGLTGYLFSSIYPDGIPNDQVARVPNVDLGFLDGVPVLGDFLNGVFGELNLLVWLMFAVVILSYVVLFKTPIGLRIRSVGEHPRAADTVGISVYRVRYLAVVTSGVLAALGGAFLSIGFTGTFSENMTSGRGFIALAAVIFGKWRPGWAFVATLLFGFGFAVSIPLQREADISANIISTLPYVLTLIAVAGLIGRSIPPAAVGRPYVKQ